MGKAERRSLTVDNGDMPGPGAYQAQDAKVNKGAKIGTSKRRELSSQDSRNNPGPGAYEVAGNLTDRAKNKFAMGVKYNTKKMPEILPGPGAYEPFESIIFEKMNGAVIGTSERPPLYKKGGAPGPGQYDTRGNIGTGTKAKIGNGRRQPIAKVSDDPGPGYYNIPSAIGNVPKYLLPSYAKEKKKGLNSSQDSQFKGIFGGL